MAGQPDLDGILQESLGRVVKNNTNSSSAKYFRVNETFSGGLDSSGIPFKFVDGYTLVPNYELEAYIHDPGIIWEDYTGDFPQGSFQPLRGYIIPSQKRGARNPYRGDNYSDEVTSHETTHLVSHIYNAVFNGGGVDEEREVRRRERYMGWGTDYNVRL